MKTTLTAAMKAHLASRLTTLATCWKITRTDGVVKGFTDHDKKLTLDGVEYLASSGFFRSAISSSAGSSVDNLDVKGFLDSDHISAQEMRNHAYDFADVEIFAVNWADLAMGEIPLRTGKFGETQIASSGLFKIELRGLTQLYSQTIGDIYQPECRVDFGDSKCKLSLYPDVRVSGKSYAVGDRVLVPGTTGDNVSVPIVNPDFETVDSGWHTNIDYSGNIINLQPKTGTRMGVLFASSGGSKSGSQTVNIAGLGLDLAALDNGSYQAEFRGWVAAAYHGCAFKFEVQCLNAGGGLLGTITEDYNYIFKPREWAEHVLTGNVPANTRQLKYALYYLNESSHTNRIYLDQMSSRIFDSLYDQGLSGSWLTYGGVEYECTVAGVSDSSSSIFSTTISDVIVDGTVTWTVVEPTYTFTVEIDTVTSNSIFTLLDVDQPNELFNWGVIQFLEGDNIARKIEVKKWDNVTKTITLALPAPYLPVSGQKIKLQAGCDKSRARCMFYNNIINMRAEPDLPGTDKYFKVGGANTSGES